MADCTAQNEVLSNTEETTLDGLLDITTNSVDHKDISIKTEVSDLNCDLLSCNDTGNIPTLDKQESLNDVVIDALPSEFDKSSSKQNKDYNVGDIVWAKIGKYPFWPSIVCVDPGSNTYIKRTKARKAVVLHVRFCNDNGRRSWTTHIEEYCGKLDLLKKFPNCLSCIKNNQKLIKMWNLAVEEADNLKKLDGQARMLEFLKTFLNSDELHFVTPALNNSIEETASSSKVHTYSKKRSLTYSEVDKSSKLIKAENTSVLDNSSSRSIDIPHFSRSDDADSTVSDTSDDVFIKTKKKRRSTKTYPPKSSCTDKYKLSDYINNSPEYSDEETDTTRTHISTRWVSKTRKFEINLVEQKYCKKKNYMNSSHTGHSKKMSKNTKTNKEVYSNNDDQSFNITLHSQNTSTLKKTVAKKNLLEKETSTGRKSISIKMESSPEPDTTESEASSKNETYNSVFLTNNKNKRLFVKSTNRACVVCKNIIDTVKCVGPCQSYFHKECLDKSEERYYKPIEKIVQKRKKQCAKSTSKNEDFIIGIPEIEVGVHEKNTDNKDESDNLLSKPLNGMKFVCEEQNLNDTPKIDELHDQSKSDDLSNNLNDILVKKKSTQLNEIENINKDLVGLENGNINLIDSEIANKSLVPEIPEKLIICPSVQLKNMTAEKKLKNDIKHMCSLCKANKTNCFVCGLVIEDPAQKVICKLYYCGKYYHKKCLEDWPQCQWNQGLRNNIRCVICPHHVCHLCISDNPKSSCKTHFPAEKLTRCIKCPTAYHRSVYCLPAGSQILTYFDIICSRHFEPSKTQNYHFNATWCFICTLGGALICCDLCPSSFHIECLNQNPSEFEGGFTCEECQTGRYPLYGEIVWVKIGNYRWWPAQIVFPNQVPDSINAIAHSVGQFAVRFFGSYNYYWVNRGRVFNFHEGDDENVLRKNSSKGIDQMFQDATIEAAQAHNAYVLDKDKNDAVITKQSSTKPPKYTRIKFNKPFGNVKNMELAITPMTSCECDPFKPNPCGPGSDCINRMLMFECQPQLCSAGDKCNNQRFEKVLYPSMEPFLTKGRGWGLRTLEDIKEGSFVIEYVGDVIDEEEFQRRCQEMHKQNEQNYYFLTIDHNRMIDAGPRGNLSRFMNHSCEPNCFTQKWTVNGDTRIGLFALHDIPAGTELVFDYRLQSCSGVEKKPCQCGAARCSKFIGVKVEEEKKKVIAINDTDKCKTSTKCKRKPLKIKENVSDSVKSKSSKAIYNDQDISTTMCEIDVSNTVDAEDNFNESKTKTSVGISSLAVIKNENSETSETLAIIKNKRKNSTRNTTNLTKKDNAVNYLESKETNKSNAKQRNHLSSLPKQLIKDETWSMESSIIRNNNRQLKTINEKYKIQTNLLSLSKKSTKVLSTCPLPKIKGHVIDKTSIEDVKSKSISKKWIESHIKIEQIPNVYGNANASKTNESFGILANSRSSLPRLAKSRHSFLSKNDSNNVTINKTTKQDIKPIKEFKNNKQITAKIVKITKHQKEMQLAITVDVKQNKTLKQLKKSNQQKLSTYHKNDSCLICGKGQAELACKNKKCPRVFHLCCINKNKILKSGFICPSHFCSVCKKRKVVAYCKFCVESFCSTHAKENIFKDPLGHGMLCTSHSNKKQFPVPSTLNTPVENVINKNTEHVDSTNSRLCGTMTKSLSDVNDYQLNIDEIVKEEYPLTQVIKDECDREYIHIGGFNVCHIVSDLATGLGNSYSMPVDTDGDLFKPSSANVVIDIESASALYQSTDNLQLVSIATDNKADNGYANVNFVSDVSQTKNKWLATEP